MKQLRKYTLSGLILVLVTGLKALGQGSVLTTIDFPGATSTSAWGVNIYRDVVGLYTLPDKSTHGFLLRGGALTSIDYPGAGTTDVWGINNRGDIVGDFTVNGIMHGFLFSHGTFTNIDYPGSSGGGPAAINNHGEITGAYNMPDGTTHGFLFTQGHYNNTDFAGAISTLGNGLNDAGDIVENYNFAGVTHGAILSNGFFAPVDYPGAAFTGAYGINSAGDVAGRYRDAAGVTHGYLLSGGKFTSFDIPGSTLTSGAAINDTGDIAGRYVTGGISHGFLLAKPPQAYTLTDLGTLPGGTFSQATFIGRNGVVAGLAALHDGTQHAVLWQGGRIVDIARSDGLNSGIFGVNRWGQALVQGESSAMDPNQENFCAYGTGLKCLPFLWQGGFMTQLPTLGGANATVGNINSRGEAAGVAENSTRDGQCPAGVGANGVGPMVLDFEAVIWGPGQGEIRELHPLPGDTVGEALWINDKGQAVGASGACANTLLPPIALGPHAVLWEKDGSVHDLGNLGGLGDAPAGLGNAALSINNRGDVVGASTLAGNKTSHAFLWNRAMGMRDLGTLAGGVLSFGSGINESGEVVGTSLDAKGNPRAWLWQNGTMTDLNTLVPANSPLFLMSASAINDSGEIAGFGATSVGDVHAFLATPIAGQTAGVSVNSPPVAISEEARRQLRRQLPRDPSGAGNTAPR